MIQHIDPILNPDNRRKPLDINIEDIIVGGTTIHTFEIPLNIITDVLSLDILYGYGIDVVIDKTLNDYPSVSYTVKDGVTSLKCVLSPEDTIKFKDWYRDATVQLKFVMFDGGTTDYSDIYYLRVLKTLDNN